MELHGLHWNTPWIWSLFKDHVAPNIGVLVGSVMLFMGIGFLLWILLVALGARGKWFRRHRKWHSVLAKLAYVWWLLVVMAGAGAMGAERGLWKILERETPVISRNLYASTTQQVFKTDAEKVAFVEGLRTMALSAMHTSDGFTLGMVEKVRHQHTGYGLVDSLKNKGTDLVMDQVGEEVSKGILYGVMKAGGKHVGLNEDITYGEFNSALDAVLKEEPAKLENEILEGINHRILRFIQVHYHHYLRMTLLLALLLFSLPLVELFIYRAWLRRKREAGIDPFNPEVPVPPTPPTEQYEF